MAAHDTLLAQAHALRLDLERLMRQEAMQGHLSPTDTALLRRVCMFLDIHLPQALSEPSKSGEKLSGNR